MDGRPVLGSKPKPGGSCAAVSLSKASGINPSCGLTCELDFFGTSVRLALPYASWTVAFHLEARLIETKRFQPVVNFSPSQCAGGPIWQELAPFMDPEAGGYPSPELIQLIQLLVEHGADAQCAHAENNSLLKATKRRPPRHALQTKRTGGIFTSGLRAHSLNAPPMQAIALN